MPANRGGEALREFETAIAYGDNRAATTFALARAGEQGQALTLPEGTAHTDVHQTCKETGGSRATVDGPPSPSARYSTSTDVTLK